MKSIYISLTIVEYNTRFVPTEYKLCEKVDDGPMEYRTLTRQEAMKMQWELKKIGATREYVTNMFNPAISYCSVTYWARH